MKSFLKYILPVVAVACSDSLELLPEDTLTPEQFYSNPTNLPAGLIGVYDAAQAIYSNTPLLDGITDNGHCYNFAQDFQGFGQGTISPVSVVGNIVAEYQNPYVLIQRANLLLANMDVPRGVSDQERNSIEFEARTLRALAYMRLAYLFGEVPFYTTPLTRDQILNLSNSNRSDLIAFIIDELAAAKESLTPEPFDGDNGRITSLAASALLARVYLFEARLGNLPWQEAKTAVTEAILLAEANGKGIFQLSEESSGYENYSNLFYAGNEDNNEVIWSVKFDELDPARFKSQIYLPNAGTLNMTILNELVDSYYTIDGLPITDPNSVYNSNDPYNNRDPRLAATVIVPGSMYSDGVRLLTLEDNANPVSRTSFYLRKFTTLNGNLELDMGQIDAPVIRHAELLLMLAESENEINGPTGIAQNAINRVRDRVQIPRLSTTITQDELRNEVIHERRVELAFEGARWFDLITLGVAEDQIDGIENDAVLMRDFVPNKQERFPYPQTEIDIMSELNQNPGY